MNKVLIIILLITCLFLNGCTFSKIKIGDVYSSSKDNIYRDYYYKVIGINDFCIATIFVDKYGNSRYDYKKDSLFINLINRIELHLLYWKIDLDEIRSKSNE